MDRQSAVQLDGIEPGHRRRYEFAAAHAPNGTVLDAACGTGYGAAILAAPGRRVIGVDIDRGAIEQAKQRWPGDFIKWDIHNRLFGRMAFDAVISFETLEHLPKPEVALNHFRFYSNFLICSVPNEEKYPFDAERFAGNDYPHLRHYTPDELVELLETTGWRVNGLYSQAKKASEVEKTEKGEEGRFLTAIARCA